jgi:hypothetical protein
MRNISTTARGHYDDDGYMWAIIIRRFCDTGSLSPVNYKGVSALGLGLSSDRMLYCVCDQTRRA